MRRVATLAFVFLLLGSAAFPQLASGDRAELLRLETVWNHAHESGDFTTLRKLWADDIEVAVPKMPVLRRADLEQVVNSGRIHFERYQTSDLAVRVYGTSAVVTGRLQRLRTINSVTASDDWRFTKVYVKQDGQWRVVSFHASEAAAPAP